MAIVFRLKSFRKLVRSKVALALPVTFLILLVSTLGIIAVTYALSIGRISAQGENLKVSTAKQSFLSLDDVILSTLWQPGSSETYDFPDSGGLMNVQPTSNLLTISINVNSGINQTIFNSIVGKLSYEILYTGSSETGLYLKGDGLTITNESGSSPSQLFITIGAQYPEIQLRYRPQVSYAIGGLEDGKAVNNIRIYVINLNSSDPMTFQGHMPLKVSCTSTQLTTERLVGSQSGNFVITSQLDNDASGVSVPISSTSEGSIIYIETVISNVSIERRTL